MKNTDDVLNEVLGVLDPVEKELDLNKIKWIIWLRCEIRKYIILNINARPYLLSVISFIILCFSYS